MKNWVIQLIPIIGFIAVLCSSLFCQDILTTEKQIIQSKILAQNKTNINTQRKISVVLPNGYAASTKVYPVVYYLQNAFEEYNSLIEERRVDSTLAVFFDKEVSQEFILVIPDFSSPTMGSFYENSTTSGMWLDYVTKEVVPFIDENYRTIRQSQSRAVIGFFFGGYGAFKLGMLHADLFGVVYAMHPVASGSGYLPRFALDVDWAAIHAAKSYQELEGTGRTQVFASICQAYLPNNDRPPLYCDFLYEYDEDGALVFHPDNARKEQKSFHLDELLDEYTANLRNLKAVAFDWARFDGTQAHVISNRRLSKLLMDIGVDHLGEEFAGTPWTNYWSGDNRFYNRLLPFLNGHLSFSEN